MNESILILWGTLRRRLSLALMLAILGISGSLTAAETPAQQEAAARQFATQVQPVLVKYCQGCHAGEKPKADFRVQELSAQFDRPARLSAWQAVFEQLDKGTMPPAGKPRPTAAERELLQNWISAGLQAADVANRAGQGRTVLRRLNRVEFENTVCDLLGIQVNLREQLPQDGSAGGFDNASAALHTSSFLMERYLEAADVALDLAIANRPKAPASSTNRYHLKDSHPVRTTTESVYRFLDDETVVCLCSSAWHNVHISKFYPSEGGQYRFRISASGYQSDGQPITFRVTDSRAQLNGKNGLVGYFDAAANKPTEFEFVRFMEPRKTISILPYGLPGARTVKDVGAEAYEGPGLAVHWVEVEGPLHKSWPPESHRQLFGDLKQESAPVYNFRDRVEVVSDQPLVDAQQILQKFARRAFRRSVTDEDVQPFVNVVEAKLAGGYTFEQAMRAALKGIMISPEFVFLREPPGVLDDFALASRLAYFLWSTMPDEPLLALAEQGQLSQPDVLRQQVQRMLADPKARQLTENFVGQWLSLREIDFTEPSHILYPDFDHMLKVSMVEEAERFFQELLKDDLSLLNLVESDFAMLNGRLAQHYGIAGPVGWEFQKVQLPPDSHRGGVMTMAGVLKVTANGTTTSPVMRGAWVLDRILGTPPSPPPSDVPAIVPDTRGATTIREQLSKHRSDATCAACHAHIDPAGFALESLDVIGGYREFYRTSGRGEPVYIDGQRQRYLHGPAVDPADALADGREFANIDEFKQLLLDDKDQIAGALARKLLTYATGSVPTVADTAEVDAIVARVSQQNYGLRSLIHEIVQSKLFREK